MAGVLGIYGLINASFLKIKEIGINGLNKISEEQLINELRGKILEKRLPQFLGFNHFISWPSQIALANPLISKITIDKNYFENRLAVFVEERKNYAIWCYAKNCYWFDETGILLEPAPVTEGTLVFIIRNPNERPVILGKSIAPEHLWKNTKKILDMLSVLPIKTGELDLDEQLQELTVKGTGGEKLIFSLRFAPSEKMFHYIQNSIATGEIKKAEYIDLTVENRIYLKERFTPTYR